MKNDIANRFKFYKQTSNLQYKEIADKFENITLQQIKDMANGNKNITPELALQLEEKLGINPIWLIFGRGEMIEAKIDLGVNANIEKENFNAKEYLEKQNEFLIQLQKDNEELHKRLK